MKLRYTPRAVGDIAAIGDYIAERNPAAAELVGAAIERTIGLLRDSPGLGADRPELGVRRLGVPRYDYSIYYRIRGEFVEIAHVPDDRRRPLEPGDV